MSLAAALAPMAGGRTGPWFVAAPSGAGRTRALLRILGWLADRHGIHARPAPPDRSTLAAALTATDAPGVLIYSPTAAEAEADPLIAEACAAAAEVDCATCFLEIVKEST